MNKELGYGNKKFICPFCKTMAQQEWKEVKLLGKIFNNLSNNIYFDYRRNILDYEQEAIHRFLAHSKIIIEKNLNYILPDNFAMSQCQSCNNFALWVNKEIVYPKKILIDAPNSDMNQDIQNLYNEAALILTDSPKGAAALLRLALQKLLWQIGETERNIDKNIKNLVAKGLNPKIQKALDFVRVVGNEAVHPGEINLDDNKEIAISLFKILNLIANDMITIPKEMDDLYENIIPEEKKQQINARDGK
ncbi:hypothetical protein AAW30_01491 [Arcobacter porcinus]|uniref:DUF4145 domain-containing protein n=1 Tax=Arcobacter porcinus TaxID=1935204 RepID=UPI000824F0B0|nr:DUF4145 domain-containing protein [Arcobacter porcinus]OCL82667.1 hypothetical protein AAW30_01491 [Arcobacter porcinus]